MAHFACHLDGRRRGLCEALNVRRINHRLRVDHAVEREVIERFAVNDGLEDHFLLEATVENRLVDETLDVS